MPAITASNFQETTEQRPEVQGQVAIPPLKIAKVALSAAADTAGAIFAWQNPSTKSIVVEDVVVRTTAFSTGACTVDIGTTATSATTLSDNLMDGVNVATAVNIFTTGANAGTNGKQLQPLASGKWVTASTASGAIAGTAGYALIYYRELPAA